jgi:hypothetical protein
MLRLFSLHPNKIFMLKKVLQMSRDVAPNAGRRASRRIVGDIITAQATVQCVKCMRQIVPPAAGRQKSLFARVVIAPYTAETVSIKIIGDIKCQECVIPKSNKTVN